MKTILVLMLALSVMLAMSVSAVEVDDMCYEGPCEPGSGCYWSGCCIWIQMEYLDHIENHNSGSTTSSTNYYGSGSSGLTCQRQHISWFGLDADNTVCESTDQPFSTIIDQRYVLRSEFDSFVDYTAMEVCEMLYDTMTDLVGYNLCVEQFYNSTLV